MARTSTATCSTAKPRTWAHKPHRSASSVGLESLQSRLNRLQGGADALHSVTSASARSRSASTATVEVAAMGSPWKPGRHHEHEDRRTSDQLAPPSAGWVVLRAGDVGSYRCDSVTGP